MMDAVKHFISFVSHHWKGLAPGLLAIGLATTLAACTSTAEQECHLTDAYSPTEVLAETTDPIEVWSLWIGPQAFQTNLPVAVEAGKDIKIVWSSTGEGEFNVQATDTDGAEAFLRFGPEFHDDSNWDVPGDEWGTGWNLPPAGCWTFNITRGTHSARVVVEATE
jgi:hypothetical protein